MGCRLRRKNIASSGIGAMIVIMAIILVAGIAGYVLLKTANKLELQGSKTGDETQNEFGQGVGIFGATGYCPTPTVITRMVVRVRARAGTEGIDLSTAYLQLSDSNKISVLTYGNILQQKSELDDVFQLTAVWLGSSATKYNIIVVIDSDNSLTQDNPIINQGDLVLLTISTSSVFNDVGGLEPRTTIFGYFVIEEGVPGVMTFRTPPTYTKTLIKLL